MEDFGRIRGPEHGRFAFGLDKDRFVSALRKFADEVESGKVAPCSVTEGTLGTEDFAIRNIIISYMARVDD